jgi:hypothetical protein
VIYELQLNCLGTFMQCVEYFLDTRFEHEIRPKSHGSPPI